MSEKPSDDVHSPRKNVHSRAEDEEEEMRTVTRVVKDEFGRDRILQEHIALSSSSATKSYHEKRHHRSRSPPPSRESQRKSRSPPPSSHSKSKRSPPRSSRDRSPSSLSSSEASSSSSSESDREKHHSQHSKKKKKHSEKKSKKSHKSKKKLKKHKSPKRSEIEQQQEAEVDRKRLKLAKDETVKVQAEPLGDKLSQPMVAMPPSHLGTGSLSTNKTIIKGYATKFKSEIQPKDGILLRKGKPDEVFRIVRFVVSDTSLSISTPFVNDVLTPTQFHIVPNPHRDQSMIDKSHLATMTTTTTTTMNDTSREELLDLRMKSKTDRMC